jgi:hypothetical protein
MMVDGFETISDTADQSPKDLGHSLGLIDSQTRIDVDTLITRLPLAFSLRLSFCKREIPEAPSH